MSDPLQGAAIEDSVKKNASKIHAGDTSNSNRSVNQINTSVDNLSQDLQLAQRCLSRVGELVDGVLVQLNLDCQVDNKLDSGRLDNFQLLSYELTFCVADLGAALTMIRYAQDAKDQDQLCVHVALCFSAESLQCVHSRLLGQISQLMTFRQQINGLFVAHEMANFLSRYLDVGKRAQLGAQILNRDDSCLPSLLDEDKELVRSTFARFAKRVVAPRAEEIHRQDLDIPEEIINGVADLGAFGISIPETFGGLQPDGENDSLGMIVITEELSRASLGAAGSLITRPEIVARALLSGGTLSQQQKWLPPLASGEKLCAVSITEPNYGSDVASISLKATAVDGGWLINGSKTWCTFAGRADVLLVLARTNPDASLGYKGLSLFLIDKPRFKGHEFTFHQEAANPQKVSDRQKSGGKLTGKAIATIGYRGMHSFELFFEDLFVPGDQLIGESKGEGKGFYYTMAGFSGGRIQTAARATGVMQAAFDHALTYAKDRQVFNRALGDYQLTQVKLGRMLCIITACRQFSYAVAKMLDSGCGQMEASLVKLYACRAAEWVTREAIQLHGGMGYAEESAVSRYFLDARVLSIFEGAEETLALKVVARELIANAGKSQKPFTNIANQLVGN